MGFTFDIVYRYGSSNPVADLVSRQEPPHLKLGALITTCQVPWVQVLAKNLG